MHSPSSLLLAFLNVPLASFDVEMKYLASCMNPIKSQGLVWCSTWKLATHGHTESKKACADSGNTIYELGNAKGRHVSAVNSAKSEAASKSVLSDLHYWHP